MVASPVVEYFEGSLDPGADELVSAVHRIMTHADARRRLGVRANSDTGEDSARAVRFGAQGIGLTRTEHMFLGERRQLVERLILAEDDEARQAALARARAAPARRLRRDPRGDGRPAGHDQAARPAAARVPARPDRAVGQGRAGRRPGDRQGPQAARGGPQAARAEPDARPARRPARPGHPRPVRDAGPGDRARGGRPDQGGRQPAPGDHDPAGRRRAGARGGPRRGRAGAAPRWPRRPGSAATP